MFWMTHRRLGVDLAKMVSRWPGLVALSAVFAVGCSHPAPPPKTAASTAPAKTESVAAADLSPNKLHDRRTEAGVRAPAKPLVLGKDSQAKCGKIGKPEKSTESELLVGRLKIHAPAGAKAPEAKGDGPSAEEESRLVVDEPAKAKPSERLALAIVAKETFQLDPDMYEPDADAPSKPDSLDKEAPKFLKATMGGNEEPFDVIPVEVGEAKLRGYLARPAHPNAPPGKDTALVAGLLLEQEDGSLQSVAFYVRGEGVRNATGSDLVGCTRLAERSIASIAPGPRKLERTAGKRHVADVSADQELVMNVPADYVVVPTNAAGGSKIVKLRPLSLYAGSIAIAVADKKKEAPASESTQKGKLLGQDIEWKGQSTPKGGFYFAAEPVDPQAKTKYAEVLVKATRQAKALDEMRGVAETLSMVKREPAPAKK